MEFSRQKYWNVYAFPSPWDIPNPGIQPRFPHCRPVLYHLSHQGSPSIKKKKKGQNERNWKVNLLMWGKAVCRVEWDWQGAEERLLIWYPFGLGILLLFYYSKSPTCEPFTCKLSKMWMCICMSNHLLVHASGWHCHMCASSTNGCVFVYFTAQYYIEYSIFISSPRCLKTSVKVMI